MMVFYFPLLTLYFAPWCPHSQEFMSVWNELQQTLLGSQLNVQKIDVDATPELVPHYVYAYPTVTLLKNGRVIEFRGKRTLDSLLSFIQHN